MNTKIRIPYFTVLFAAAIFLVTSLAGEVDAAPNPNHFPQSLTELEHTPIFHIWKGFREYRTGSCLKMYWHLDTAIEKRDVLVALAANMVRSVWEQTLKCRNERFA